MFSIFLKLKGVQTPIICSRNKQFILQVVLNNICLAKEHCYQCEFEGTIYNIGSIITNRRRCLFGVVPDEWDACLTFQENNWFRKDIFNDIMNRYLFKKHCNLPTCNLCYNYRHSIGSMGPGCNDIIGSIQDLRNEFTFVIYENKPKF